MFSGLRVQTLFRRGMKIVLLSGWSQTGKDTVGTRLCTEHGFQRFAFADPVKDSAAISYGFQRAAADTQEGKASIVPARNFLMPSGRSVRDWIIYHGEERKRVEGADVWAKEIAARISAASSFEKRFVITDWRFPEELVALQRAFPSADFYPVRLVRQGQRVSPVGSMTEYSLCGFPMPSFESESEFTALLKYVSLVA